MLQISPTILSAFEKQAMQGFIAQATAHGCAFDPEHFGALPPAARQEAVAQTVDIAHGYGVMGEAGIICLLEARCALGPDFPEGEAFAWARALLSTERTDETRTLEYLRDVALHKARARPAHA